MNQSDEEFAQFVFYHFGGYWMNPYGDPMKGSLHKLPERIETRVEELAKEVLAAIETAFPS